MIISLRLLLALALLVPALASHLTAAEKKVSFSDRVRSRGIWKAAYTDPEGNERIAYDWRWLVEPLQVMRHVRVELDANTKQFVDMWAGFVIVDPSQQQFQGLYFGSDGWVGETSSVPTERGAVIIVSVTGTNRSQFHMTVTEEHESDTAFTSTSKGVMYGGNYVEQGQVIHFKKVDQTFRELMDSGEVTFGDGPEPIAALAPLRRLVGQWRSVGTPAESSLELRWSRRMGNNWLLERWQAGGESGSGGFNITGVNPATGMLTLWTANANYVGISGRWDVISDNVLGQIQAGRRLIREFSDDDTFKAHWQVLTAGSFVDVPADQDAGYTAKRVPRDN